MRATISFARQAGAAQARRAVAHSRPGPTRVQARASVTRGSGADHRAGARSARHHVRHAPSLQTARLGTPAIAGAGPPPTASPSPSARRAAVRERPAPAVPRRARMMRLAVAEGRAELFEALLHRIDFLGRE